MLNHRQFGVEYGWVLPPAYVCANAIHAVIIVNLFHTHICFVDIVCGVWFCAAESGDKHIGQCATTV